MTKEVLISVNPINMMSRDGEKISYQPPAVLVEVDLPDDYIKDLFDKLDGYAIEGYHMTNDKIELSIAAHDRIVYLSPIVPNKDSKWAIKPVIRLDRDI